MKEPTLRDLMERHEVYACGIAEREGLGRLQARSVEGRPADPVRTAVVTYRFERGVITHDGIDYRIERTSQ